MRRRRRKGNKHPCSASLAVEAVQRARRRRPPIRQLPHHRRNQRPSDQQPRQLQVVTVVQGKSPHPPKRPTLKAHSPNLSHSPCLRQEKTAILKPQHPLPLLFPPSPFSCRRVAQHLQLIRTWTHHHRHERRRNSIHEHENSWTSERQSRTQWRMINGDGCAKMERSHLRFNACQAERVTLPAAPISLYMHSANSRRYLQLVRTYDY